MMGPQSLNMTTSLNPNAVPSMIFKTDKISNFCFRRFTFDYLCLNSGLPLSCLGFVMFWLQIYIEFFALFAINMCLTLSVPNFRRHLSSAFFILTNYRLDVELKD